LFPQKKKKDIGFCWSLSNTKGILMMIDMWLF
jgi:hypothetical protein